MNGWLSDNQGLSDIAAAVTVSQQAVSKMAEKDPLPETPMAKAPRRELFITLSSMLADDGFIETYWYGTDPVVDQVRSAIRLDAELTVQVRSGGEVASIWRLRSDAPVQGALDPTCATSVASKTRRTADGGSHRAAEALRN